MRVHRANLYQPIFKKSTEKKTDDDEHIIKPRHWKPYTLSTPFISSFTFLAILFLIGIEILLQHSYRNGAIVFANMETREIPTDWYILFDYVPLAVAVLYGLLWTWIDHDVKRMEPYFMLSRDRGAKAEDSLLMDYPYSFIAAVPIVAARRRHWAVFLSGIILILTFWIVTPAMGALFSIRLVERTIPTEFTLSTLIPTALQATNMTINFAYLAYDHVWLNSSLPGFANESFAILPFTIPTIGQPQRNETWTGISTLLSVELNCTEAILEPPDRTNVTMYNEPGFVLSNGDDCSFNTRGIQIPYLIEESTYLSFFMNRNTMAAMMEEEQQRVPTLLNPTNCSRESVFLEVLGHGRTSSENEIPDIGLQSLDWTAIFCYPKYTAQEVTATVEADTQRIVSYEKVSDIRDVGSMINRTFYEDVLFGYIQLPDPVANADISQNTSVYGPTDLPLHKNQIDAKFTNLTVYNTITDSNSIAYFGLASEPSLPALMDPERLENMLSKAYKLLFALAVTNELSEPSTTMNGSRTFMAQAVVIEPVWARVLEGTLAALTVLSISITVGYWNRKSNLGCEPGSLATHMAAITTSDKLLKDMEGSDWEKPKDTAKRLINDGHVYYLKPWGAKGHVLDRLESPDIEAEADSSIEAGKERQTNEEIKEIHPAKVNRKKEHWELGILMGVAITVVFLTLLIFLVILYSSSLKYDGLPWVSSNKFVHNLVFSYIPTVIATLIEPFWVLIARYTCLVMPFEALRDGFAPSSTSLTVNYNSKPPHFVLYRSLKSGHFLLAALALMTLLANVLAVTLGGLFDNITTQRIMPANFTQNTNETLTPTTMNDFNFRDSNGIEVLWYAEPNMFYVKLKTISSNTSYPPWVSPDYYFLPFSTDDSGYVIQSRKGITRGFGSSLECIEAGQGQVNMTRNNSTDTPYTMFLVQPECRTALGDSYLSADLSIPQTTEKYALHEGYAYRSFLGPIMTAVEQVEWIDWPFFGWTKKTIRQPCSGYFGAGWARAMVERNQRANSSTEEFVIPTEPEYVGLMCKSRFTTGLFSVEVGNTNRVISYEPQGELSDVPNELMNATEPEKFLYYFQLSFNEIISYGLHDAAPYDSNHLINDRRPLDWPRYILSMEMFSGAENKFNFGIPIDIDNAARALERTYSSLFAIFLYSYSFKLFQPLPAGSERIIEGEVYYTVPRVRMSPAMVYLSISILALFTITAICAFFIRPGDFLNYLPMTIATKLALIYDSPAIDEIAGTETLGNKMRSKILSKVGGTYGYGWFRGRQRDGRWRKMRFGVSVEPLIARGGGKKAKGAISS